MFREFTEFKEVNEIKGKKNRKQKSNSNILEIDLNLIKSNSIESIVSMNKERREELRYLNKINCI